MIRPFTASFGNKPCTKITIFAKWQNNNIYIVPFAVAAVMRLKY